MRSFGGFVMIGKIILEILSLIALLISIMSYIDSKGDTTAKKIIDLGLVILCAIIFIYLQILVFG